MEKFSELNIKISELPKKISKRSPRVLNSRSLENCSKTRAPRVRDPYFYPCIRDKTNFFKIISNSRAASREVEKTKFSRVAEIILLNLYL